MNSTDLIRAYFDSVAATWLPSESDDSARKAIISLSQVPSGCEIADIGCGKGVMLPYLLGLDPKSICEIDVSAEMIRLCKATCSDDRVHFIADDFLTMPEMAFDFIIIFNAYPHFTDKRAFSRRLASFVRHGGSAVIAHSKSREAINSLHKDCGTQPLSVKLRPAAEEFETFSRFFFSELLVDNEDMYLLKLRRK